MSGGSGGVGTVQHPAGQATVTQRGALLLAGLLCSLLAGGGAASAQGADTVAAPVGRAVSEVIDDWRRRGVPFAYSTELLDERVVVIAEPASSDAREMVSALLAPYGLRLYEIEGLLVVGRAAAAPATPPPPSPVGASRQEPALPEVTVSASRYEVLRELLEAPSFISQRTIQQLPLLGEDPLRAVQRLPGNASSGLSAKSHLRGSAERDTGLVLNGQRLLDPFHVRDYQNLFSAIDARAIAGVEVYTGGFPVQYGDGLGGLVLIDTISPDSDRQTEIGLSVYNTSFLTAGRAAGGDVEWLLSARRGNLDLVLNGELGEPSYNDVFAEIGFRLLPGTQVSINALVANDNVVAVTETDPAERETSSNDTRNAQFWINWSQDWSERLSSYTTLSVSTLGSARVGRADDPEEIIARVDDNRDIDVLGLRQGWAYDAGDHRLSWGAAVRHVDARFRYRGSADLFGHFASFRDRPTTIRRDVDRRVDGDTLAVYLADRWSLSDRLIAEFGLRWDKQTYTDAADSTQFSPRLSLLYRLDPQTDLRLSAGRYFQSHAVDELQVEDGVTRYFPAERADQLIVGLERRVSERLAWRAEAYVKDMSRLRTRYESMLDPLAVMPELKPDRVAIPARDARARGVELSLGYDGESGLSWWLSYTLAEAEDRLDGRYVPRSWDQRHAGQLGILWQNADWDLSAVASAHSGWPKTGVRIVPGSDPDEPELEFTERNAGRFATFATLDLRVARRVPVRIGELTLFAELSNATNRDNPCCVDFGLEDVDDAVVLEQLDEYWFPLLPAVGILWEF